MGFFRHLFFLVAVLSTVPVLSSDLDIRFPVSKTVLENGLTVLLYEDHSSPLISYHTWFRVGSKHEKPGATGLAHLFEHMMFKGTKKYGNKQFDVLMQNNGISNNAFTTRDYTAYFENLPSGRLELVLDIESDRMRNLIINQDLLNSEREVVKEERRYRVDGQVMGQLFENLYATLYKVSPYRWPVVGYMRDLEKLSPEQCQEFYDTYYAPNNAVLVIGGDIDSKKTLALVKKYYDKIKPSKLPKQDFPIEPEQKSARESKVYKPIASSSFSMSYKIPKVGHIDNYALDLLSSILGEGESSRLYKSIVYKKQWATSIYAYSDGAPEGGAFHILVNLKPGVSSGKVSKEIQRILDDVASSGVSKREFQKSLNLIQSSYVRGLKTIEGKVKALALNEILFGDYSYLFSDLEKYSQIQQEQIKVVAAKYLKAQQLTKVEILSKGKK